MVGDIGGQEIGPFEWHPDPALGRWRTPCSGGAFQRRQRFLWPNTVKPEKYTAFRIMGANKAHRREALHIPPEEVANAAAALLFNSGASPEDGLVRSIAKTLGFARVGSRVETAMTDGIDHLVNTGRAERTDRGIRLVNKTK